MASHVVLDQLTSCQSSSPCENHLSVVVGPEGYLQARLANLEQSFVDHRPYLPNLLADPTNPESIKRVACQILHAAGGGSSLVYASMKDWIVSSVSGGITNLLFRVSGLEKMNDRNDNNIVTDSSVLVRVFGGHGMIDRDIENATFSALWKAGIAPTYYGRFGNGRVEEYKYVIS
jgi:ethanolamine kinase